MIATALPDYLWQIVGSDLLHHKGTTYLLIVDYFSRYPEIVKLTDTTVEVDIYGFPDQLAVSFSCTEFLSALCHTILSTLFFHSVASVSQCIYMRPLYL